LSYKITLIRGDGIGPEVTEAAMTILDAAGADIQWEEKLAAQQAIEKYGEPLPEETLESIQRNRVCLKGPLRTEIGQGFTSVNVALRKKLDLYAGVRQVVSLPGVKSRFTDVDIVVIRENTEGMYSGIEHEVVPGVVESLKIITERASLRIARFAFEYARRENRKKVTAIHKANIMKLADGMFLNCARRIAQEYPDIQYEEMIIDNASMQLVLDPTRFDVLLLENLYGDILSDLCAGLVGGLGVVPGANIGDHSAVFEAVHGTAPDIAGKNLANPTALVLTAAMMLRHLGEATQAERIYEAVKAVIAEGKHVTRDLGGTATTTEMTAAIVKGLR